MYKLLIVEDDKILKFGLKKCLEEEGYSIVIEEDDIVKGFDLGAEDYITKPFSINVFLKKIAAIMRRCYGKEGSVIVQGDLTVYPDERKVLKKMPGSICLQQNTRFWKFF